MSNKLSSPVITQLSFLTLKELQTILGEFNDIYDSDRYDTWKHLAKHYTDEQITPLLKISSEVVSSDKRTKEEKLEELKSYYIKSDTTHITTNDIPALKRGRQKKDKTLKDEVFELLNTHMESEKIELDYKGVLGSGILNIAENTFKTILSSWRKEHGIRVKRGRKANG